ncbi:MAG: alcohol dehydrogenase catalytic domain-containing protein [Actinobacteria bacterium]|nr:alcohol dehydrogenase catalytic domain-containing protein [Actinomycetota bacterium]MCL5446389.1 alcohol dehydrogenase catalytic domain-containing protein [Actinomycetota bacterium]
MRAVLLESTGPVDSPVLRLAEVEKPDPGPGEVVIKVSTCGVCHSNLHMIEGDWVGNGVPAFMPIIPGHEVMGTVDTLGTGVDWLHTGQRVGVQPLWTTCGRCEYCLTGREELCQSKDITGETVNGGYADYMLAKALHCYPVPDEIDDVEAAPLFCPGITAYSAVSRARLAPGRTVGVFGIGGVGHMVLQFARLTGAEVIAVTRSAVHGGIAGDLGADRVVDAASVDPVRALKEVGGVDSSIVFAPASDVVQQAVEATKPGGTIVVGVSADISHFAFADEKRIVGSVIGPRQGMMEVLALAAAGKVKPVCDTFALEDAPDVLLRLKHGEIRARAVLKI